MFMQTLRQSDKCFCQYQFWCKNVNVLRKKIEILGEMLTFSLSVHYYWKWLSFCKICLFLEKCDFLCEVSNSKDMLICICVNFN